MSLDTVAPQPAPSRGTHSVTDAVIDDLQKRREGGVKKYGTELQTFNGRNALIDCYQELLDATLYIRQQLTENKFADDYHNDEMGTLLVNSKNMLSLLRREVKAKWVVDDIIKMMDVGLMLLNPEENS